MNIYQSHYYLPPLLKLPLGYLVLYLSAIFSPYLGFVAHPALPTAVPNSKGSAFKSIPAYLGFFAY
jgi:hypothetical protein